MLTREQARTKYCPIKMAGSFASPSSVGIEKKYLLCTANDCPKWVDTEDEGSWMCPKHKDYIRDHRKEWLFEDALKCAGKNGLTECDDCPHRYGRCGG